MPPRAAVALGLKRLRWLCPTFVFRRGSNDSDVSEPNLGAIELGGDEADILARVAYRDRADVDVVDAEIVVTDLVSRKSKLDLHLLIPKDTRATRIGIYAARRNRQ